MPSLNQSFPVGKLIANDLTCWRGHRLLFTNIHFTVNSGEILLLAGHNGIGKSSLLALLAGLLKSYNGNVSYSGHPIGMSDTCWLGVTLPFYPEISLYENLRFWAILNDCKAIQVDEILYLWQLHDHQHLAFNQLSRGQQQRAHLSRLAFTDCPIWLLDEPLTGLDQLGLAIFQGIVTQHLKKRGIIVMAPYTTGWDTKILNITDFNSK